MAADVVTDVSGNVWKVLVAEGDEIKPRQVVAILEAMKLEINVEAPDGGKVEKLEAVPQ